MAIQKPLKRRYGRWTVLGQPEQRRNPAGTPYYVAFCRCRCGHEGMVRVSDLNQGVSTRCGRCRSRGPRPAARKPPELRPGYGAWTVLGDVRRETRTDRDGTKHSWYTVLVQCKCGTKRRLPAYTLYCGKSRSCGCLKPVPLRLLTAEERRLRKVWYGLIARCYIKSATGYASYGGRGITVCDEWRKDYLAFEKWALENGTKKGLHLDRRDSNKGYSPENCRFVTPKQNARNTRRNIMVTAFGETKPISAWVEDPRCSVSYGGLYIRLVVRCVRPVEAAISLPPRARALLYDPQSTPPIPRHIS